MLPTPEQILGIPTTRQLLAMASGMLIFMLMGLMIVAFFKFCQALWLFSLSQSKKRLPLKMILTKMATPISCKWD